MPMAGLEPARLTPLPPQDSVSTNSTTSATSINYVDARNQKINGSNQVRHQGLGSCSGSTPADGKSSVTGKTGNSFPVTG